MHPNAELLSRFYAAFAAHDGPTMASCYHPDARFSDPVFPGLQGAEPGEMWKMLTSRAGDLRIEFRDVVADDQAGSAHWEAWYTFSATGKKVHNVIDATFRFRDGKIVEHNDVFDLYAWTRQALGLTGLFLGWTPMVQNKVRATAGGQLRKWIEKTSQNA